MAHFDEPFHLDWRTPETVEQTRAWDHVERVFGRQPSSIRSLSEFGGESDTYLVKLQWGLNETFEFICASGLLVGVPPKGRGKK